jgi:hypothetical protein
MLSCMYIGLNVKYMVFLSDLHQPLIFSDIFSKNPQISNFINIRPVGNDLCHVNRRTDRRDEINGNFSQFFNDVNKSQLHDQFFCLTLSVSNPLCFVNVLVY